MSAEETLPEATKTVIQGLDRIGLDAVKDDLESRNAMIAAACRMIARLETPFEAIWQHTWIPLNSLAILKITIDLELWQAWRKSGKENATLDEMLSFCNKSVAPNLLRRLLRHLVTDNIIHESGEDRYGATHISKALGDAWHPAHNAVLSAIHHCQPSLVKFPSYLARTNYQEPLDSNNTNYMDLTAERLCLFQRCGTDPTLQTSFTRSMQGVTDMKRPWPEILDASTLLDGYDGAAPLVVDIGGAHGHDLEKFLRHQPDVPAGSLVLQDRDEVIAIAKVSEKIKPMAHDFFTPQPVIGARAYYLHAVVHDWDDDNSKKILERTREAMKPGYSKLLLHETVMPRTNPVWYHTFVDNAVMHLVSGYERTEQQWHDLVNSAGLKITKIWSLPTPMESVIEAEVA